jgi:hypothetical protein
MGARYWVEPYFRFDLKKNNVRWIVMDKNEYGNKAPLLMSTTRENHQPRLMMYMDSFGLGLRNFIASHFSEAVFFNSNQRTDYPHMVTLKTINTVKPDIVIIEVVERSFNDQHLDDILQRLTVSLK